MSEWAAIERVERPGTLAEAAGMLGGGAALLAGGSYLMAERPAGVTALVDVRPLLGTEISDRDGTLRLEAGATLQQVVDTLPRSPLAEVARASTVSRNLRNQRTLGGEVARSRADSDLAVALAALNPLLELEGGNEERTALADWRGGAVVTALELDAGRVEGLKLQRFSLLPTAPAFLVVAAVAAEEGAVRIALGGRAERITTVDGPRGEELLVAVQSAADDTMNDDHTGSLAYKRELLRTALARMDLI